MRRLLLFVGFFIASLAGLGMALRGASYAATFSKVASLPAHAGTNPATRSELERDSLRQEDLQQLYQDINRESFDGKLPDVPVRWGDLTKDDAYGITHFESGVPYAMELDRQTVKSKSFALDVIRHESCHIASNSEAKQRKENPHGATFMACMARIQDNQKDD